MKKLPFIAIFGLFMTTGSHAQGTNYVITNDSIRIPSLEDIIESESNLSSKLEIESRYKSIWGKTTYLNLCLSSTKFSSSDFPTDGGSYMREFKNKMGFGIEAGNTYNFHKKPIGTVLFIGIDYTPLDLNFNMFDEEEALPNYSQTKEVPFCLPWHNKKITIDYGMALGPSLTFYPFTAINNRITNNIRLQFYYHLGYHVGLGNINNVVGKNKKENTEMVWGIGLSNTFGLNLTWNIIGIGYEQRQFKDYTYRSLTSDFDSGAVKCEQTNSRVYIQFRF